MRPRRPARTIISLFPFLSLFLCVLGIMSFFQVLLSLSLREEALQGHSLGDAGDMLRILCTPDSLVVEPPPRVAAAQFTDAALSGLAARLAARARVDLDSLEDGLEPFLAASVVLNKTAEIRQRGLEIFVLLGVTPNSAACVHRVSELLDRGSFRTLRRGLQIAASEGEFGDAI